MPVKEVPTLGWTRRSAAVTLLLVTQKQRRDMAMRISACMAQQNLNIPKLARKAELSDKTVSRVLNARTDPRVDTIERIAKALGTTEMQIRGPAPTPLGLGAESQLDKIERMVSEVYALLIGDASHAPAAVLADVVGRIESADGLPPAKAPVQQPSRVGARRRRTA